jgi:hypothetical protein
LNLAARVTPRITALIIAAAVLLAGAIAAWHYSAIGLALSHYDARAHLVVARRIFDSLMPGWQQIGAVWLPLPHVLNMLPVQIDALYRSGASAIAISVLSMAAGAWALAALVLRTTGSVSAAAAGGVLLLANPNILYLQSTPMTEPLLFGTVLASVCLTAHWIDDGAGNATAPGWTLIAACMTRYEAWLFTAALVVLSFAVLLRRSVDLRIAARACARLAVYPGVAIALFILNSRWTTGHWFLTSGFFVPENEALGSLRLAWEQIREGLYLLSGPNTVRPAYAGAIVLGGTLILSKTRASLVLVLATAAVAALPLYAFYQGHPFRIRYSVPLVVACAAVTSAAIAMLPRWIRGLAAAMAVTGALLQNAPFDRSAPLIAEAQRDAENMRARAAVTSYLEEHYDGRLVMMSMGSLAHYMHDLSRSGFRLRDFLHEGIGDVWLFAVLIGPRGHVGWIAIEEKAEGGDVLFHRSQEEPRWLDGFERVAEGGGVALYRAVLGPGTRKTIFRPRPPAPD